MIESIYNNVFPKELNWFHGTQIHFAASESLILEEDEEPE
jgi:hypothetical protein